MKSKQSQSRLSTSLRSTEVSELDDSRLSLGHKGKCNFLLNLKLKNNCALMIQLSLR